MLFLCEFMPTQHPLVCGCQASSPFWVLGMIITLFHYQGNLLFHREMEPYRLSTHRRQKWKSLLKTSSYLSLWLGTPNRSVAFDNCSHPIPIKCLGKLAMAFWCGNHFEMCRLVVKAISPTWASRTTTKKIFCKLHKMQGFAKTSVSPNWSSNCF